MLNFVFAESALELVPKEISKAPAVASDSRRRGLAATEMLLDRSFHNSAMDRLRESEKRGRPDLVHAALLSVTGTPLYLDGKVNLFVHTCRDVVLAMTPRTRLPKNYIRFRGLAEKTLAEAPNAGLVRVINTDIEGLVKKVMRPDMVVGLSVRGSQVPLRELAQRLNGAKNPCLVVGGFAHGHFSEKTSQLLDDLVRIDSRPLEAHVVAARAVYEVEKAVERTND